MQEKPETGNSGFQPIIKPVLCSGKSALPVFLVELSFSLLLINLLYQLLLQKILET